MYDFYTSYEAIKAAFAHRWFRKYIQDFSGYLVLFERSTQIHGIFFDYLLHGGSHSKVDSMKNTQTLCISFFGVSSPISPSVYLRWKQEEGDQLLGQGCRMLLLTMVIIVIIIVIWRHDNGSEDVGVGIDASSAPISPAIGSAGIMAGTMVPEQPEYLWDSVQLKFLIKGININNANFKVKLILLYLKMEA